MKCPFCGSLRTAKHSRRPVRYKCCGCKRTFSENAKSFFYRFRFPKWVVMMSVLLCLFMRSEHVRLVMYLAFNVNVSKKSILKWTKKYLAMLPCAYAPVKEVCGVLIVHADEKFFKVRGKWAYWWSLVDNSGNLISCAVTQARDLESAKLLFKNAKIKLGKVDFIITDGLQAYVNTVDIFGKNTKHIVAGMKGKIVNYAPDRIMVMDNNIIESLNSEIDIFLSRFRYNFSSIESAQRWMRCFMLTRHLLQQFKAGCEQEPPNRQTLLQKPLAPFQNAAC